MIDECYTEHAQEQGEEQCTGPSSNSESINHPETGGGANMSTMLPLTNVPSLIGRIYLALLSNYFISSEEDCTPVGIVTERVFVDVSFTEKLITKPMAFCVTNIIPEFVPVQTRE